MHANAQLTFSALHSPRPPAQGTTLPTRKRVFSHQLISQGNQSLLGLPNPDNPHRRAQSSVFLVILDPG